MFCRFCGKELQEDSNYCPHCGNNQNNYVEQQFSNTIPPAIPLGYPPAIPSENPPAIPTGYQNYTQRQATMNYAPQQYNQGGPQSFNLFKRFVGTLIDKIFIVVLFLLVFIAIFPFKGPGLLGVFTALFFMSPHDYEYISHGVVSSFNLSFISTPGDLDNFITVVFSLLNIIYYVLSEALMGASPGKRFLGGIIIDSKNNKVDIFRVLLRGICGGALIMASVVTLHNLIGLSYLFVVPLHFLILDVPLFFIRQSLIDLGSGTIYAKRKTVANPSGISAILS